MIYCINPECQHRLNSDKVDYCQSCGTSLLIKNRYRLVKPLRNLDQRHHTELWEVDDRGMQKVLKIMKDNSLKLVDLFKQEAMILQSLKHPGIPKVEIDSYFTFIANNSSQELHCLVMEKIAGENLEDWVKIYGAISEKTAIAWLKEITEILGYVHENSLFHRDIKPSNIILTPEGKLVLIDFGAAREITYTYLAKLSEVSSRTEIISSGYTPLEQINGKAVPQSDFYALGRTFVYLLTSKHPNKLPENAQTGKLIWEDKAPPISWWLVDLINDMMAPFPGKRPQTAQIILDRLNPSNLFILRLLYFGKRHPKLGLGISFLLIIIVIFALILPGITRFLNEKGYESFENNQLEKATLYFQWALKLDPNFNAARYNLGALCEQTGDLKCARLQYEIVSQDNRDYTLSAAGISNLSRIYIREKKYKQAIKLLAEALDKTDSINVKSALHKNLGWAYFQNKQYKEAESQLKTAIQFSSDRASSYCLLAQVQEAQKKNRDALNFWQKCLNKVDEKNPDDLAFKALAIQRLNYVNPLPK